MPIALSRKFDSHSHFAHILMGALCSKPSVERPQRVVLGSGPLGAQAPTRPADPRKAAAAAAERRLEEVSLQPVSRTNS